MSVWCKICGQTVDTSSLYQSESANCLGVHQEPCLHIFFTARYLEEGICETFGDAIEELSDMAAMRYMMEHELTLPYLHWLIELFIYLRKRPAVLLELTKKYDEGKRKSDESLKEDSDENL